MPFHKTKDSPTIYQTLCACVLRVSPNVIQKMPIGCQEDAVFLIDTSIFEDPKDILADDNGSYRNNGSTYILVECSKKTTKEEVEVQAEDLPRNKAVLDMTLHKHQYIIQKTWYVSNNSKDFSRRIFSVFGSDGCLPVKVLQYSFKAEEHKIIVKPHGNSKINDRPFVRTMHSTKGAMAEKVIATRKGPGKIYDELYEEKGGIFSFPSQGSLPRNTRQVKYHRALQRETPVNDELSDFIDFGMENTDFVCNYQLLPSPRVVLATPHQVNDIVSFCTDPESFTVLGIDTTYNICNNLYVTPLCYKHLKLFDVNTNKHPLLPGPVLLSTHIAGVSVYFSMVGDTIFQVGESHTPPPLPPPFRPQCAAGKKNSGLCWGSLDWLKLHLPHLFILVLYNEFHDFYDERFKKKL